ncbi:MAG: restriction endonuclease subunit S [Nanoarchaeota archaeon]|nr:restriction endonuclease subunit S [Nanoarchaeota archaeon]
MKASLLFLRKKRERETLPKDYPIFMGIAEHIGYDATGRPDKDEFPDILMAWQEFKKINKIKSTPLYFMIERDKLESRIDPIHYQRKANLQFNKCKFNLVNLGEVVKGYKKGVLPKHNEKGGEIQLIQIKNITMEGEFDIEDITTAKTSYAIKNKDALLEKDDLLIVITGATIGKVALWNEDKEFYLGSDMIRIKLDKTKISPYYLLNVLLSDFGQKQILSYITGATNKHLSPKDIMKIRIPLPPIKNQEKIAEDIQVHKEKAKKLKEEAKEVLSKAKEKVERMILDGNAN